ncbi:lipopolysaccharide core heptose(II) kinase RfaY [Paenibacillus cremeus]|uniref:lipopolysaccharide core heptose(II) kinase RfaY n=1 Tax=Paenibacillus cremeus TaxID=2163881 RepID=UPI001C95ECF9|nr:lipopolysaccharide core heptose(II) kinase RfaY [Paenibacillus cremeus]
MDKFGLPRPISGSFASVYKIKCGKTEWAVRCFTSNVKDQKVRYDAISSHLSSVHLPYFVPFEYLSEGIKINGDWFPIVKMQWVEGESLLHYIERNLDNVVILKNLANKWIKMIHELHMANMAHGDLQHGNILIQNDEIILIDYDGMYVPGLTGLKSNELGHRNYQHPGRDEDHFGAYVDNFSAWVIWISILALSSDASVLNSLNVGEGEESLLFRQQDFVSPGTSRAFEFLELVDDELLRSLVSSFRELTSIAVPMVPLPPNPELRADPVQPSATYVSAAFTTKVVPYLKAFSGWLANKKRRLAVVRSQSELTYSVGSSWVLDYLTTEAIHYKFLPKSRFLLERIVSLFVIISTAWAVTIMYGTTPVIALVFFGILSISVEAAFLSWRYLKQPSAKEKRTVSKKIKELQCTVSDLTSELNKINDNRQKFKQVEEDRINDILRRQLKVSEKEKNETEKVEKELQRHVSELVDERHNVDQEEQTELAEALGSFQNTWLVEQLKKHRISKEKIPEIDDEIKRHLRTIGIHTLADFSDINIYQSYGRKKIEKSYLILKNGGSVYAGISPAQAKALTEWKKKIERSYRSKIPQSIPLSQITTIQSKFFERKSILTNEEQAYKTRAQHMINNISQTYTPEYDLLKREEATARCNFNDALSQFDTEIVEINKRLAGNQWELHYLSKLMNSFNDVNFLRFLSKVFLSK